MFTKKIVKSNKKNQSGSLTHSVNKTSSETDNIISKTVNKIDSQNVETSMVTRGLSQKSNIMRSLTHTEKNKNNNLGLVDIGNEVSLDGNIEGFDRLNVNGHFNGELHGNTVIIGPCGHIEGILEAEKLEVLGQFSGEAKVAGHISVANTGQVSGILTYKSLDVASGGRLTGHFKNYNLKEDTFSKKKVLNETLKHSVEKKVSSLKGEKALPVTLNSLGDNSESLGGN